MPGVGLDVLGAESEGQIGCARTALADVVTLGSQHVMLNQLCSAARMQPHYFLRPRYLLESELGDELGEDLVRPPPLPQPPACACLPRSQLSRAR